MAYTGLSNMPADADIIHGQRVRELWKDPSFRERVIAGNKKKWSDPEYKRMMGAKFSIAMKGIAKSPEHRTKLSLAKMGKKGPPKSIETRKKISLAAMCRKRPDLAAYNRMINGLMVSCVACKKTINWPNYRRHHDH